MTLTVLLLIDFIGCWAVEQFFKYLFSDYRPKDIAVRRKDQLDREMKRKADEAAAEEAAREVAEKA